MKVWAAYCWLATSLLFSGQALAQLPAAVLHGFNAALEEGDPAAITEAAKALIDAALLSPDDPYAREAAFEAATQLCLRDACSHAKKASSLMAGPGSAQVSSELASVLVAYADWESDRSRKNAAALEKALRDVVPETPTFLTILAFDRFYLSKLKAGDLQDMHKIADLAATHYKPVWTVIPENWATMELAASAASFGRSRNPNVIDRLAELEVALYPFMLRGKKEKPVLVDIYYQTQAWRLATESWFRSGGPANAQRLDAAQAFVDAQEKAIRSAYYETRERPGPFCKGGLSEAPKPSYPSGAAQSGYVGAVLIGFEINDDQISNVRVLASVPDNKFERAALDSMKGVKWVYFDEQPDPACNRRNDQPVVIPFQFNMTRPYESIRRD